MTNGKMTSICNYKIADIIWQIETKTDVASRLLLPYRVQTDTVNEVIGNLPTPEFESLLLEINARLVCGYDGLMLHGGALVYKGKTYIFTAPSGTGKTTHLRMWESLYDKNAFILCGDKPLLRLNEDSVQVYCGPWKGKEDLGIDTKNYPLGAVYFLRRGTENNITAATTAQKLRFLTDSVLSQKSAQGRIKLIQILSRLCEIAPAYILECNPTKSAAQTVRAHIDKEINGEN